MIKQLQQSTDEELMMLLKGHNHEAFSVLVSKHSDRFYALSYRTLFNQADAEDIVQESFLKLWRKPELWKEGKNSKFTTWFYRIIVNACYDLNKKKSSQETPLTDHDWVERCYDEDESDQQLSAIEIALKRLPERQRTALNLCFYEGLSNAEAADVMGLKLKALQSLIMRGKATLKAQFNLSEDNDHEYR